jgi:hypothetical protein
MNRSGPSGAASSRISSDVAWHAHRRVPAFTAIPAARDSRGNGRKAISKRNHSNG